MRIALLEDDQEQAELVQLWLNDAGHQCSIHASAKDFLRFVAAESCDLLILDWLIPDMTGLDVLKKVRAQLDWPIPIIFSTQQDSEEHIVSALSAGADDYMIKPAKRMEMIARIEALARRSQSNQSRPVLEMGAFSIHQEHRQIYLNEQLLELTQKEYDLALFLFSNADRVISRGHILESVWGTSPDLNTRTVDTHISRIRKKLALNQEHGWKLSAIYQHGYRLERVASVEA